MTDDSETLNFNVIVRHPTPELHTPLLGISAGESKPPSFAGDNSSSSSLMQPALNTLKTVLRLFNTTLDSVPVPGLKGIIGGILFIMDTLDMTDQAEEDFAELEQNVKSIEALLSKYRDPAQKIPPDVKSLVDKLAEDLDGVNAEIQSVVSHQRLRKMVESSADAGAVVKLVKRVNWATSRMMAGIALNSAGSVQRLEESGRKIFLDKIARAKDASWKHLERPTCLVGTRVSLLEDILKWVTKDKSPQVFWLNGLAGTGKTTIAQSVAEITAKNGKLGASFFCSRDSSERSDYNRIFPTIAFQLAESNAKLGSKISDAVKDNLDISLMRPDEQLKTLILGPLQEQGSDCFPLVIVIDALDECSHPSAAEKILLALSHSGAFSLPFLKVFVTSRPISSTRAAFKDDSLTSLSKIFVLHEMDARRVDKDIRLFINVRLKELARRSNQFGLAPSWPPSLLVEKLVQKSSAFFIFASTACQYIGASGGDLEERLQDIANLPTSDYEGGLGIDALYKRVFDTAFLRFSDTKTIGRCRSIIGTIILLQNPITLRDLAFLLELKEGVVISILNELRSLLVVPDDPHGLVRPFHASLEDFLTDRERCTEALFIDRSMQHLQILLSLLKAMNRVLKRNICQINRFSLNQEVEDLGERNAEHIGSALGYACRHWADHLNLMHIMPTGELGTQLGELLNVFAREKLLNWIEVLSLLGTMSSAVSSLEIAANRSLDVLPQLHELAELFRDGHRTALQFFHGVSSCASQIYYSVLPLVPTGTLLRKVYRREDTGSVKVLFGLPSTWNACLRTIDVKAAVSTVTFSPDGNTIAASCFGHIGAVGLWSARTGEPIMRLNSPEEGNHTTCAFLLDGSLVFSSDGEGTMKVWNAETSDITHTLRGHDSIVHSIALSPTGRHLASAADIVLVWDTSTWESVPILGATYCAAFSNRGMISCVMDSDYSTIGIWDAHTKELTKTMRGHTESVLSLNFSPDGGQLVSGGADDTVRLWDVETGEQTAQFNEPPGWALSVAFSPNSVHVAGSDNAVRVWNVVTGEQQVVLLGHQAQINSAAFSPDGKLIVSGSTDHTLKIWDWQATGAPSSEEEEGHSEWIQSVAISPNSDIFVTSSWDRTVALWDANNGKLLRKWEAHGRPAIAVVFAPDGRNFASAGGEIDVKLWNSTTGDLERTLICNNSQMLELDSYSAGAGTGALAFSLDGSQIALGTEENLTIWTLDSGDDRCVWERPSRANTHSIAFSDDKAYIATGYTQQIWLTDLRSDACTYFDINGIPRQLILSDTHILSSVGIFELPNVHLEPDNNDSSRTVSLKTLHLSNGWIVDTDGKRHCWVPEVYRGDDVHASRGTRLVLGGANGRPSIIDVNDGYSSKIQ